MTAVLSLLGACANIDLSSKTVQQGNLSALNQVQKLRLGMSKHQVKNIMGTSLITPLFSDDRWDYANTSKPPRKDIKINSVSLYFKHDQLVRIQKTP